MKITENVDLSRYSFMKIGGKGSFLVEIEKDLEVKELAQLKKDNKLPIFVIGEGSNSIFSDEKHQKTFVHLKTQDIIKTYENDEVFNIKVSSGLNWDRFVEWSVANNLSGIESLSGIPGTVGACPIQNIGAYGQEVKDVITGVEIYEFETEKFYDIPNSECNFGYRDSIFKKNLGQFIITNVSFRLFKKEPETPTYKDLSLYFLEKQNKNPTLREIRKAVLEIRKIKLPDWKKEPNCGSFFKNPIIENKQAKKLAKEYPDLPQYRAGNSHTKISGGWLIEKSGFKGKTLNKIKIHPKNCLILINEKNADFKELQKTILEIKTKVRNNFDINLEIEPNLIF